MSSNNTIPSVSNPPDPEFPFTQPANTTTSSPSPPSPIEPASNPPFPEARASDRGLAPGVLAGLITGAVLGATFVLIGVCVFVCFYKRKKRKLQRRKDAEAAVINGGSPLPSLSDPKLGNIFIDDSRKSRVFFSLYFEIKFYNYYLIFNSFVFICYDWFWKSDSNWLCSVFLILDTCSWFLNADSCFLILEYWILILVSWFWFLDSWFLFLFSWFLIPDSCFLIG